MNAAHEIDTVLRALADPTRRQLVEVLARHAPMTVTELAKRFPVTRQAITRHLSLLREARVIRSRKRGRDTVNQLSQDGLAPIIEWTRTYSAFWDQRLMALKVAVEGAVESERRDQ